MRVLHVEAGMHLYGGALQVVFLLRGLKARGIHSVLACPTGSAIAPEAAPHAEVVQVTMKGDADVALLGRLRKLIREVKPAIESAGARYLARGGPHKVHEGDWSPRRIVLIEFPSVQAWESFYNGPVYQGLKAVRDECSSARLVCVEGLAQ